MIILVLLIAPVSIKALEINNNSLTIIEEFCNEKNLDGFRNNILDFNKLSFVNESGLNDVLITQKGYKNFISIDQLRMENLTIINQYGVNNGLL